MKKEKIDKIDQLFLDAQKKLGSSNCSVMKMREFLKKKGGNKKEINEVIFKLKKYSFLDEDEMVKNVISYCDTKHYGYNKIISMLKQREIDKSKISKIQLDFFREEYQSRQMTKRLKKRYKNRSTLNLQQAIYCALLRYGFEAKIASARALEVYNLPQEELNVLKLDYLKLISNSSRRAKDGLSKEEIVDTLLAKGYKYNDIRKVEKEIYEMD